MIDPLDDIPAFLILTAAERRAAWEHNPPKPMVTFTTPRDEDANTVAFREQQDQLRKVKARNRIGAMKATQATPRDLSRVRWDSRHNRFIPLTPDELVAVPRKATKRRARKGRSV